MTTLTEADVEQAGLAWLEGLGWQVAHGGRTSRPALPMRSGLTSGRWLYPLVRPEPQETLTMNRNDRLRQGILSGRADANIRFDTLRLFLLRLGFVERVRVSHHVFRKEGVRERLNLQRDGSNAKPYQVRQVRQVILRHQLEGGE